MRVQVTAPATSIAVLQLTLGNASDHRGAALAHISHAATRMLLAELPQEQGQVRKYLRSGVSVLLVYMCDATAGPEHRQILQPPILLVDRGLLCQFSVRCHDSGWATLPCGLCFY